MACTRPIPAWRPVHRASRVSSVREHQPVVQDLDNRLSFAPTGGDSIAVPCGKCAGCARERSAMWTTRLFHERLMHERATFLTLTYDDLHLPSGPPSIKPVQDFLKRLRESRRRKGLSELRYFCASELGGRTGRLHHHMIVFGEDWSPRRDIRERYWSPKPVLDAWGNGNVIAAPADTNSLAYVAGYTLKKVNQAVPLKPVMSRNRGIGFPYIEKFGAGLAVRCHAVVDGRKVPVPNIYINWLESEGIDASEIRLARSRAGEYLQELRQRNATGIWHAESRELNAAVAAKRRGNKK